MDYFLLKLNNAICTIANLCEFKQLHSLFSQARYQCATPHWQTYLYSALSIQEG